MLVNSIYQCALALQGLDRKYELLRYLMQININCQQIMSFYLKHPFWPPWQIYAMSFILT